ELSVDPRLGLRYHTGTPRNQADLRGLARIVGAFWLSKALAITGGKEEEKKTNRQGTIQAKRKARGKKRKRNNKEITPPREMIQLYHHSPSKVKFLSTTFY